PIHTLQLSGTSRCSPGGLSVNPAKLAVTAEWARRETIWSVRSATQDRPEAKRKPNQVRNRWRGLGSSRAKARQSTNPAATLRIKVSSAPARWREYGPIKGKKDSVVLCSYLTGCVFCRR